MENVQDRDFLGAEKPSLVNLIPIDELKGEESILFTICAPTGEEVRTILELKEAIFYLHWKKRVRKWWHVNLLYSAKTTQAEDVETYLNKDS